MTIQCGCAIVTLLAQNRHASVLSRFALFSPGKFGDLGRDAHRQLFEIPRGDKFGSAVFDDVLGTAVFRIAVESSFSAAFSVAIGSSLQLLN
jgi:hypothetical protein